MGGAYDDVGNSSVARPSEGLRRLIVTAGTLVLASAFLSAAALYNGFPLVFPDTAGYLTMAVPTFRSPYYGVLIQFFHLKTNLWPIVFGQSLLVAHLLLVTVRVVFDGTVGWRFLGLVGLLTALTSLPWFAGQIMPDLFAPVLVLGLFLLAFCRRSLNRIEIGYLFVLTAGAIAVHTTHLPLSLGLVLVLLAMSVLLGRRDNLRFAALGLIAGPSVLAALALITVNAVAHGAPSISPGGPGFLLARSLADGPAYLYLREVCPDAGYRLCADVERLSQNTEVFLWSPESPFKQANGFVTLQDEAAAIVKAATKTYPVMQAKASLRHWLAQLVTFGTATELISYVEKDSPSRTLEARYPAIVTAYTNSRQGLNRIPIERLRFVGNIAVAVSFALGLGLTVVYARRRQWLPVALFGSIVLALLGNALLTGAISAVFDRYQSRLIWLIVFYATAGLLWLKAGR